jgi:V/A-type H+-transporting ATPase subunit E
MGNDVASFAKQLKEDGIEAAKKEAESILKEAEKEADKLLNDSKAQIEKLENEAQKRIAQKRANSEAEIRLAARDLMNSFRNRIENTGCMLLQGKIAETMNDQKVVKEAISELLKNQKTGQEWEVSLGKKIAKPLAETVVSLFKEKDAQVKFGEELKKAGFELRNKDGNEVIEVTEESVTDSFRKLLSPELRKIIDDAQSEKK